MNWKETLVKEHENISMLLNMMETKALDIYLTKQIDKTFFEHAIYFIENYADKEHHQKEENGVFECLKKASNQGKILVENGMMVEHQQARYYVKEIKKLLNSEMDDERKVRFLSFVMVYIDLLRRHIEKENHVVYPYAEKVIDKIKLQTIFEAYPKAEHEKSFIQFIFDYR